MAEYLRTRIAREAVERLKGVLRGQGYKTDLGRQAGRHVGRRVHVLSLLDDSDFPCAVVLMAPGEPEPGCIGSFREDVEIGVLLYGKHEDIPEELERLEGDAMRAVLRPGVFTATQSPPVWKGTHPFYNEVDQTDRGMVLVTFAAKGDRTPDSA